MVGNIRHWLGRSLMSLPAAALLAACAGDAPIGPNGGATGPAALAAASVSAASRTPDLGSCADLAAPAGSRLALRVYAQGDQIYRWDGSTWVFVAPAARLFADAAGNGEIGSHYGGPTWESVSGSKVIGAVEKKCTPDANAIPWLRLRGVSSVGPGIFDGISTILRINTVGGTAPVQPGSIIGETANVPYTTEYLFYRAE